MGNNTKSSPKLVYESQESLYEKAEKVMNADQFIVQFAFKEENYLKAAEMFESVGNYKDAIELAQKCRKLAEQVKKDEAEYRYQQALYQKEKANTIKDYEKAGELFKNLSEYKNCEQEKQYCEEAARELQKKRKVKNTFIYCTFAFILILIVVFLASPMRNTLKNTIKNKILGEKIEDSRLKESKPTLENGKVGDMVSLGKHQWFILEKDDVQCKLIMAQAEKYEEFRHTPYHQTQEAVTWEKCSLRKWLNSDFLTDNFSEAERKRILTVDVKNDDNSEYGTSGGNDTQDKVFLLSSSEVRQYHDILSSIRMNLWLRTPGNKPDTVAFMSSTTTVMDYGYPVSNTNFYTCPVICVSMK